MKLLLAVDGSRHSQVAANRVAARPWPQGTQVKVLHVIQPAPVPSYGEHMRGQMDEARRVLDVTADELRPLRGQGVRVSTEMIEGSPKEVILREAESWGADLIVVGSHGYGGLQRFLLGSVSQAVALHARCSVEIARIRG